MSIYARLVAERPAWAVRGGVRLSSAGDEKVQEVDPAPPAVPFGWCPMRGRTGGRVRRVIAGFVAIEPEHIAEELTVNTTPETVFAVLGDPTTHASIDRTGNVRAAIDQARLTEAGQFFRMAMYHDGHPDKHYTIANLVEVFDEPRAIAWKPGTESSETGEVSYGGWVWRYDLETVGPGHTKVTLTYDWSGLTPEARAVQTFPPFGVDYLEQSLQHLAEQATAAS